MIVKISGDSFSSKTGNKGKFLQEMNRNGFNVPDGIILDSDEYDLTIKDSGLEDKIAEKLHGLNKDNIKQVSEEITKMFDGVRTSSVFEDELDDDKLYAVRSSGTKEDLENFSFAGQYETFLNVSKKDVPEAVIKCYKSMFSEVILSYLVNRDLKADDLKMSVVIQEMVDADLSGICFTLDPVTGDDKVMLIEVSEGLGENIVSGKTRPEEYYFDWYEGREVKRNMDNKFLDEEQTAKYASVFAKIGQHFGYPCDIEFAIKDGELFILQSRRITKINYSGINDIWSTADFKDGGVSATVCTPYMWSLYEYIWEYSLRKFIVDSKILRDEELPSKLGEMYYGRPYWNLSAVKKAMEQIIGYKEREFDSEYGIRGNYEGDGHVTKANPKTLAKMAVIAVKQMELLDDRKKNSERYKNELLDLYNGYRKQYQEGIKDIATEFKKITHETYLRSETTYFWQIFINTIHQSMYKDSLLEYVSESEYLSLLGSIDNISHLLPFYNMWDITRKIRADEEALKFWTDNGAKDISTHLNEKIYQMPLVSKLIEDYGYHSDKELDVTYPCYYEEPEVMVAMVKDMVALDDSFSPLEDKERGMKIHKEILSRIETKVSAAKFKKISEKVTNMRSMLWWREEFRDVSTRFYYMIRIYTIEYAKKLEADKVLDKWEDVWFLKVGNLWDHLDGRLSADDLREIIRKNKIYYNAYRNYISDNEIGHNFVTISDSSSDASVLKGLGANNGTVKGIARVIEDFSQIDRLEEGDILVTRFTDTGWTSKFAILSGIVTEYGGILCHAAIVSREYGIPAIVCCKNAMDKIRDGQTIEVNGTTGEVKLY